MGKQSLTIDLKSLPKASLGFKEPMLAKAVNSLPTKGDWQYEIKLDGYRAVIVKKRGQVMVFSRRGNNLNRRFPVIAAAFDFLADDTIIDGEIVALDEKGMPSFAALQNSRHRARALHFYAFDLLAYRGKDVRGISLLERRDLLENYVLKNLSEPVRLSVGIKADPNRLVALAKQSGLEGLVAKRMDSRYERGERSGAWVKYKTNQGQELVIGGYKPGPVAFDYLLVGYYEETKLFFIGKIKNGFTPSLRRQIGEHFKALKTKECPFANLPEPHNAVGARR
jgi:bifunctional non-homologous end joining protein LigD